MPPPGPSPPSWRPVATRGSPLRVATYLGEFGVPGEDVWGAYEAHQLPQHQRHAHRHRHARCVAHGVQQEAGSGTGRGVHVAKKKASSAAAATWKRSGHSAVGAPRPLSQLGLWSPHRNLTGASIPTPALCHRIMRTSTRVRLLLRRHQQPWRRRSPAGCLGMVRGRWGSRSERDRQAGSHGVSRWAFDS